MAEDGLGSKDWLNDAVEQLADRGWYFGDHVVSPSVVKSMNAWLDNPETRKDFRQAGIGKGSRFQANLDVRRDVIFWFDSSNTTDFSQEVSQLLESIKSTINRELFTGISDFEGHFAIYPEGGFYHRHVDTFRDDDRRFLTFLLYLNPHWRLGDGGELRLYANGNEYVDIEPKAGNIVIFRSRNFEHEVLPSKSERRSFTGWFKV